jgi:hypothetical protein
MLFLFFALFLSLLCFFICLDLNFLSFLRPAYPEVLTERYNPVTMKYHVQFEAQPKVSLININKRTASASSASLASTTTTTTHGK